jgi:hypothetical protein
LQKQLDDLNAKLGKDEPAYTDLNKNYDDLAKVRESSFNGCYKTLFGDDKDLFVVNGNDDSVDFKGKDAFDRYC